MNITEEEQHNNVLGMLGLVLYHLGGRMEIPRNELLEVDLTKKQLVTWTDHLNDKFVFELRDV